jgi:hypothetical protein
MVGGVKMIHIYINTDEQGNIIDAFAGGDNIIPTETFEYHFTFESFDLDTLLDYKVENGQLVLK